MQKIQRHWETSDTEESVDVGGRVQYSDYLQQL